MKKRVLTVFLSAALCCLFCFSSAGSVKAFALDSWYNVNTPVNAVNLGSGVYNGSIISSNILDPDEYGWYRFDNVTQSIDALRVRFYSSTWHVVLSSEYDYYFTILLESDDIANFNLNVNSVSVREDEFDIDANYLGYYLRGLTVKNYDGSRMGRDYKGLSVTGRYDSSGSGNISSFLFNCGGSTLPANLMVSINLFQVPVNSSESDVQKIVNAINNQTSSITGNIDKNTDDIQQSIEDQYEVDPDEDFGVGSIIEEYEEKVGLLTFASDTFLGMLELFSPENAGEPEIIVPSWSMDIQGTSYKVWDEYRFNLRFIDENFPFLMKTVRLVTVSLFYLAIVKYIKKIAERWFLAR